VQRTPPDPDAHVFGVAGPGRGQPLGKVSGAVRWFCSAVLVSSAAIAGSPSLLRLSLDVVLIVGVAGVGGGQQLGDAG
jgi:hypothetical protein